MQTTCPHCRNVMEFPDGTSLEEVLCNICGATFPLDQRSTIALIPQDGRHLLGRFELIQVIGRGGVATVYKARDRELDRVVAIKVPRAGHLAGPAELDRFLREARSVAMLRHPAIVSVYEVGEADKLPFLVCEYVEGVTLADLLS